ncbi:MAG: glucuronate isomerase [Flavobacteriaceae bacterium]|jgi:glucuronate isomerase
MHYLDMSFKSTKSFINEDFLLQNKISKILYHDYAKSMPIIDYHNHISPKIISDN